MFGEKKRTYEKEKNARSVTPYLGKKNMGIFSILVLFFSFWKKSCFVTNFLGTEEQKSDVIGNFLLFCEILKIKNKTKQKTSFRVLQSSSEGAIMWSRNC